MSLSKQRSLSKIPLTLKGTALIQVPSYKYLGVEIDDGLTFGPQTSQTVAKTKQAVGALCRTIRKWAPKDIFVTAISSYVLPAFMYAIEIWFPPHEKYQIKLEKVLKYATRLYTNDFNHSTSYEELLVKTKLHPLYRTVMERRLMAIKRYMDADRFIPDSVFPLNQNEGTRRSERIKFQRHDLQLKTFQDQKNNIEDRLAAANMRNLWNVLPQETIYMKREKFKCEISSDSMYERMCDLDVVKCLLTI
jgi:hypothetical protein